MGINKDKIHGGANFFESVRVTLDLYIEGSLSLSILDKSKFKMNLGHLMRPTIYVRWIWLAHNWIYETKQIINRFNLCMPFQICS